MKDKLRFFNIAQSSLEECRYYLVLTRDLKYKVSLDDENELLIEVSKLLNSYCRTILGKLNKMNS
ncbi:four helix bundle protein [Tenacibaculum agarivorans]|uniref:four helix bundle protein n=1 Tax=Tenacibaculum agarivorans TaxID=1908389 RepID=UPI0021D05F10|nr:four helix bundle protein [Tenacibaculum agarivorans]